MKEELTHEEVIDLISHLSMAIRAGLSPRNSFVHISPYQTQKIQYFLQDVDKVADDQKEMDAFLKDFSEKCGHVYLRRALNTLRLNLYLGASVIDYFENLITEMIHNRSIWT